MTSAQDSSATTTTAAASKPCHNCRRHRLRCDRSRPCCHKCLKAGRECLGYGNLFRWTGAVASRGKLAGRTSTAPDAGLAPLAADKVTRPRQRRPKPCVCSASPITTTTTFSSSSDMQLIVSSHATTTTTTTESDRLLHTPYILVDPLFRDLPDSHRYYLTYFNNRVCRDPVSQDVPHNNPFRSLLPLTKQYPLLQYIIVAASAAHMSNLVKVPPPPPPVPLLRRDQDDQDDDQDDDAAIVSNREHAATRALRHALLAKHKALHLMRAAVRDMDATAAAAAATGAAIPTAGDVALAAALFFVNVELIESGKHGWRAHLQGAGRIMARLSPLSSTAAEGNVLRDYILSDCFIYFTLGSAFTPIKFQTTSCFQTSHDMASILERAAENSFLCCPPTILQILHQASELANRQQQQQQQHDDDDDDDDNETVEAAGLALLQQAQRFDVGLWAATTTTTTTSTTAAAAASRIHVGSAHRLAACLYILRAVPCVGAAVGEERARAFSRELYAHLACVGDDDANFKATSWSTFIVGAEATAADEDLLRAWVMDRLRRLVGCCPWGFLYTAMEALQVIWARRREGKDKDKDKGEGEDSRGWIQTLKDPEMKFLLV